MRIGLHLDCGEIASHWVEHAITYLPSDIRRTYANKFAFVCTAQSDAKRLTHEFREGREIIVLSERIVPADQSDESSRDVRYFIFVVLHEVAHAISQDRSPNLISPEENVEQEKRANCLAFRWMNDHLRARNISSLPEFSAEELGEAQSKTRLMMTAKVSR